MDQEPVVAWLALVLLILPLYVGGGWLLWRAWRRSKPVLKPAPPSEAKLTPEALVAERGRLRDRLRDMPGYADLSPRDQASVEDRIIKQGVRLLGGVRR